MHAEVGVLMLQVNALGSGSVSVSVFWAILGILGSVALVSGVVGGDVIILWRVSATGFG